MGEYLSQPDKTKHTDSGESQQLRFVAMGMQGWRRSMEDSHIANVNIGNGVSLFGVYDGHGGRF
jgi:protein phosphatase 1G